MSIIIARKKRLPKGYTFREDKGTYQFSFVYDGKRRYVYGKTTSECETKANKLKEDIDKHRNIENRDIKLSEYYERFIDIKSGTVTESTTYTYQKWWRQIENVSKIGGKRLTDIVHSDIAKLQKDLVKKYTTTSVNSTITMLYGIFKTAVIDRIIDYNPVAGIKRLKRKEPKAVDTVHRALTNEETQNFFKYAKQSFYYWLFAFLVQSGVRIGEASALTWSDIDFGNSKIRISKTVARKSDKDFYISDTPKSDCGNRVLELTPALKECLDGHKQMLKDLGMSIRFDGLIFTNMNGKLITPATMSSAIGNIIERAEKDNTKIEHFACHALRDTYATRCIEQGMSMHTLSKILGHSSIKTTMDLYAHVMPSTIADEMNKISIAI